MNQKLNKIYLLVNSLKATTESIVNEHKCANATI